MSDESKLRGEQAQQVLNNPVFQDAFDAILNTIVEAIASAPVEDAGTRNQLGLQLGMARAFKEQLLEAIDTAKLDADEDRRRKSEEGRET